MRPGWIAGLVLAGCSFAGVSPDAPPGTPDAPPGTPDGSDAPPSACPGDYLPLAAQASSFRVVATSMTWDGAELDCEDDGAGTHLAVPETQDERDALADAITSASFWIGVTDRAATGTYVSVVGGEWFAEWYVNNNPQPDQGIGEDCVSLAGSLHADTQARRRNFDESCVGAKPYICECDMTEPDPATF